MSILTILSRIGYLGKRTIYGERAGNSRNPCQRECYRFLQQKQDQDISKIIRRQQWIPGETNLEELCKLKKPELVASAEKRLADTRWLPEILRAFGFALPLFAIALILLTEKGVSALRVRNLWRIVLWRHDLQKLCNCKNRVGACRKSVRCSI